MAQVARLRIPLIMRMRVGEFQTVPPVPLVQVRAFLAPTHGPATGSPFARGGRPQIFGQHPVHLCRWPDFAHLGGITPMTKKPSPAPFDGPLGLIAAILRDSSPRPGAACRGRWDLFDRARAGRLNGGKHPHPDAVFAAVSVCDPCRYSTGCPWRVHHSDVEPRRALRGTQRP